MMVGLWGEIRPDHRQDDARNERDRELLEERDMMPLEQNNLSQCYSNILQQEHPVVADHCFE